MEVIRFVHAADLHLDAAFPGIAREAPAELVRIMRDSTFMALERLTTLCERERPDFLVIAGDAYNVEDRSLRAQLALRDACVRLQRIAVPVFIAHGNHDPLSSRLHGVQWPENVTVFGEELSSSPVFRKGAEAGEGPLAVVHGISHATARESRNLALRFHRTNTPCLQIGVLHCTVEGSRDKGRYAPCARGDLAVSGLDYWALGHAHERHEASALPLAVYPGCAQGLHIHEEGEKGCVMVTARPDPAGGHALSTVFHVLGPVIWRVLDVALDTPEAAPDAGLDWLEDRLRTALRSLAGEQGPECEALIVRLRLQGRTGFDAALRRECFRAELLDRLRAWEPDGRDIRTELEMGPRVWVKDLEILTRPLMDRGRLLEREDLLGEVARLAEACRQSPEQMTPFGQTALTSLFDHPRARKVLAPLTDEELARLLDDAESLCADLLESE